MKGLRPLHASPKYNADFIDNLSPEILQMQGFRAIFAVLKYREHTVQ